MRPEFTGHILERKAINRTLQAGCHTRQAGRQEPALQCPQVWNKTSAAK